jgi:phenylacetate-coenzyme A ligase PaaK-like adenylate-forming protein
MQAIRRLLEVSPFDGLAVAPFIEAVQTTLALLLERFPVYATFLRTHGVQSLPNCLEEIHQLPALYLPVLKGLRFALPEGLHIEMELTSSGTTGLPSVTPLDADSVHGRVAAMLASYRGMGIVDRPLTALAFLLDPATTRLAGSLVIDAVLRVAPEITGYRYLARMGNAAPEFDGAAALQAFREAKGPLLLIGYPALISAAIDRLQAQGVPRLPLAEGSRILTGGGWKAFLPGVHLDQSQFRQQVADFFAIAPSAIRDMYGLSECPAVFVQCEHGSYHVPSFCWAQAIDPETGDEVPAGQIGLLQLTTPLTTSYPLLKILTTDKVRLGSGCPCERIAPTLQPLGRVAAARFDTCAMKIGEAVASQRILA